MGVGAVDRPSEEDRLDRHCCVLSWCDEGSRGMRHYQSSAGEGTSCQTT
jgi:hypothetical protein